MVETIAIVGISSLFLFLSGAEAFRHHNGLRSVYVPYTLFSLGILSLFALGWCPYNFSFGDLVFFGLGAYLFVVCGWLCEYNDYIYGKINAGIAGILPILCFFSATDII